MNKSFFPGLLAVALSIASFSTFSSAQAETISLRADKWCPFNCEPGAAEPGYMIEIAKAAFESKGIAIDYQILSWTKAIEETRKGTFNGIIGANKEDASDFIFPEQPLGYSDTCFFVKPESTWKFDGKVESLASLKSIGVIQDYSYGEAMDTYMLEHGDKFKVSASETPLKENVDLLKSGAIEGFAEDPSVAAYYLKSVGMSSAVKQAGCLGAKPIYIALSPASAKSREYAKALSDTISEMKKSGQFRTLLNKYGLTESK